jgi:hypothetical protein
MGIKDPDKVGKKARDTVPLSEKVRVRSGHPIQAICVRLLVKRRNFPPWFLSNLRCPKNKAEFREYRGGSITWRGNIPCSHPRKIILISTIFWDISFSEDFFSYTHGNLPDFFDIVAENSLSSEKIHSCCTVDHSP